ncbi:peptidoglycan-binding protein [Nitratireductor luteus]|uniref:peptidoglycan-binding protein n=1 Tax=Nitratireductor luteus TaxID=2976980 RepID=UPI00223FA393|nr:peptidoglycan-binding protein [Nitratireductor luteus]
MNGKRSYLDSINAGRQRRPSSSMDEISRTLDHLESRLGRSLEPERIQTGEGRLPERSARMPERAGPTGRPRAMAHGRDRTSLEYLTRELEKARRQEDHFTSIEDIAAELKALREDMRGAMDTGIRQQLDELRHELARVTATASASPLDTELNAELERLSESIALLAERSDDKGTKLLRLELEQVKAAIASLAREESVKSLDRRWDAFEDRVASGLQRHPDPAIDALGERLEEIGRAVNGLPESLSLRSLEERVHGLAGSLEQFARQPPHGQPDLYAMVEERLDEISRAISASFATAHDTQVDTLALERIEARIASLANQLDELTSDRGDDMVVERLNTLSERVDQMASRIDVPEQTVARLAKHIAHIAERLDAATPQPDTELLFRGLEERFANLSDMIERRQEDAIQHGQNLFSDLERRLEDLAARLDQRAEVGSETGVMDMIEARFSELAAKLEGASRDDAGNAAIHALESRLEEISSRLNSSGARESGMDPEIIRNLERQVAALSAHLAQPGAELPEVEDISPRLASIEQAIAENHAAILEAARDAAREVIGRFGPGEGDDNHLREDLKELEALARRSEERNAKTFEAIHDTLLKIVNRLGSMESAGGSSEAAQTAPAGKITVGDAPSISPLAGIEENEPEISRAPEIRRTPAQAAAAAAEAALRGEDRPADGSAEPKRSMLGGLTRALTAKRGRPTGEGDRTDPVLAGDAGEVETAVDIDPGRVNEPLEPGSGAPDLNAIMRRVREDKSTRENVTADTAKADFIAAARRAAQAAAAESEIHKHRRSDGGSKSGPLGIGKILGRRKKQLLLTLGAAAVIAGGLYAGRTLLSDDGPSLLAQAQAPIDKTADDTTPVAAALPERKAEAARVVEPPVEKPAEKVAEDVAQKPTGQAVFNTASVEAEAPTALMTDTDEQPKIKTGPEAAPETEDTFMKLADIPAAVGPLPLREAASEGDAEALFEIATRFAEGDGVDADPAKAAEWYTMSAELGLAPAQYRIGNIHEKGAGVERDIEKAKMWYQLAAQQGNASAMHNLGVLYAMGADGTPDNESAARWFIEAAEHGVADSQFNLGILAAKGVGMPLDLTEAYKWFDIAARGGDTDAAAKRDELARSMAPADLAKAQGKAKLWKAKKVDPEANIVNVRDEWRTGTETTSSVDMKKAVTNIQLILGKLGFDAGAPDGVMGAKTRTAIKAFQKANGMKETGEIDDRLVRALLQRNEATQ